MTTPTTRHQELDTQIQDVEAFCEDIRRAKEDLKARIAQLELDVQHIEQEEAVGHTQYVRALRALQGPKRSIRTHRHKVRRAQRAAAKALSKRGTLWELRSIWKHHHQTTRAKACARRRRHTPKANPMDQLVRALNAIADQHPQVGDHVRRHLTAPCKDLISCIRTSIDQLSALTHDDIEEHVGLEELIRNVENAWSDLQQAGQSDPSAHLSPIEASTENFHF